MKQLEIETTIFSKHSDTFIPAVLVMSTNGVTKKLDPYIRQIKKDSPGQIACFSSIYGDNFIKFNGKEITKNEAIKLLELL